LIGFAAVGGLISIYASTNVFTASPEFGDTPSVATVNAAEPATDNVDDACPVTLPAEFDVNTIVHSPDAFVFAPALSHELAAAFSTEAAPLESANEKSTCSPAAATNVPVPVSFSNVTVNVCGAPTSFVASGAIAIFAFTNVFVAEPEFAPTPSVFRVNETPPTASVACALTVATPVTAELNVTWHEPVPPAVVHGFADVNAPGPLSFVKLICVPFGALTKPLPSPAFTFTCAVNVCESPTRFTPFGVIWIFASTNVFTASPEFGDTPSVATVNAAEPATDNVDDACPVTLPAALDVKTIVH
jgi:hypothetical protein